MLLAGVLLKMGTYGLSASRCRSCRTAPQTLAPFLGALAVVGILYGALACLAQRDLKRLIAFSSVGHMGFVLLGIATLTPVGINGALFANVAHGLITGLLFFLAGAIKDRHHTADLDVLGGGLYERMPRLGGAARVRRGRQPRAARAGRLLGRDAGAARRLRPRRRPAAAVLPRADGAGRRRRGAHHDVLRRWSCAGWRRARSSRPGRTPCCCATPRTHELVVWSPVVVLVVALGLWPGWLLDATDPVVRRLLGRRA